MRKAAKDVGRALQGALRAIETANPEKLHGIFGDAQWTNKDRLSDAMLRDLVEHFSSLELTVANLPEDELGQGYEYLIKKFADDSGHTAAEFYTNRTVVHLMTEMLEPESGESIYDPTCGSGGMLLSCIAHLRRQGKEWRNVRLFGQERNLMTSSIARMNCFLHGIEDFRIERGDTLSDPKLVERDRLMRFDVVLANPPFNFNTRAAGAVAEYALIPVDDVLLHWADEIVCMEQSHAMALPEGHGKKVHVLDLPDHFAYKDPELMDLITKQCIEIFKVTQ